MAEIDLATQMGIFRPVIVLGLWTLLVLGLVPITRFRASFARKVSAADFKYGESARVPGDVSIPNRAWMNLLEAPVLFYAACFAFFLTAQVDSLIVQLAWAYVGLRIVHSLVHLTYNAVMHRLAAFALSTFVLISLWVMLAVRLWPLAG